MSIYARVNITDFDLLARFPRVAEINGQIVELVYDNIHPRESYVWVQPLRGPQDEGVSFKIPVDYVDIIDTDDDDMQEHERIKACQDEYLGTLLMDTFWQRTQYTENFQFLEGLMGY